MPRWTELTHLSFVKAISGTRVAILPTGSLEAHGNHLPLGTDTILPEYLADRVSRRTHALVLPPIPFGDSWALEGFAGTVTVRHQTLVEFYCEVMESIFRNGLSRIVVLNGHGGNTSAIESAAKTATQDNDRIVVIVNWWVDLAKETRREVLETPEGHAAEDETSELMYVRPDLVDMTDLKSSTVLMRYRVISAEHRNDLYRYAASGDPGKANPEKGKRILESAEDELVHLVEDLERDLLPVERG
ncbi:MAG: creatininase family protein [Candidatus Thorarchaeota archaeon]